MTGFWIVFRRELAARRALFVDSAAMGLFIALLPWLSPGGSTSPAELRGAGAVGAMALWRLALAAGLGVTAVGTSLADRRLAFDFHLPAGELAIWLGRLAAGLVLVLAGAAILLAVPLPFGADLAGGAGAVDQLVESLLSGYQEIEGLLALAPLLLAAIYLLAHVASVALAGARAWLALDLAAVLVAKGAVWLAWRELGLWGAGEARMRLLAGALALAVAGAIGASAFAARHGRSEPDRAHRALAAGLLVAGLLVAAAATLFSHWFTTPGLDALRADARRERRLAPAAPWQVHEGLAAGRGDVPFAFLRNASDGRVLRLGPLTSHLLFFPAVELSADGSTLAWPQRITPFRDDARLWTLDARDPRAAPRRAALAWPAVPFAWAVAPDGRTTAALRGGERGGVRVEHEELATGRLVGLVPLPGCAWADGPVRFVETARVEVVCSPPGRAQSDPFRRLGVDLSTRQVTDLGPAPLVPADLLALR
jgi:hypothetical protein